MGVHATGINWAFGRDVGSQLIENYVYFIMILERFILKLMWVDFDVLAHAISDKQGKGFNQQTRGTGLVCFDEV